MAQGAEEAFGPDELLREDGALKPSSGKLGRGSGPLLLASIFVVASCGIIYELLAGSLSTYLLGSSITQFSMVIGLFLSAMGLGSFLSRFVRSRLMEVFLLAQLVIAVVGGSFALGLFTAFAVLNVYLPLLIFVLVLIGSLVGLEIPLLVRILRQQGSLRTSLANVLALDYLGALAASLLFPLLLVPSLGLIRTGFMFGLLNALVAFVGLWVFGSMVRRVNLYRVLTLLVTAVLILGMVTAGNTTTMLEDVIYDDDILFTKTTPYQRLVLTRWHEDVRLFIDGNIQFSSADEFRYHESLVHPAMAWLQEARRVLVLGGGDGMAVRELLNYPQVERIDLVDLDPEMTKLFSELQILVALNKGSLKDPRVKVFNVDAQKFLESSKDNYDLVLMDLPDPNKEGLGKLYTRSFFRMVLKHLTPRGLLVTQATSPFYATDAFWCIVNTLHATTLSSAGEHPFVLPYHAHVPSFGDWGFVMASLEPMEPSRMRLDPSLDYRFLTDALLPTLFVFPRDISHVETPVNRLDNQALVELYNHGYQRYSK
ncbi:MAG: polyamine aminopropyltransferase [Deltaproteobacteria bacterium]|nr:polyamine aminopropyltransferase [Deltaproteobacteria bacterium]